MLGTSPMNAQNTQPEWDLIIKAKSPVLDMKIQDLWRYRDLLVVFVKRDFVSFYKLPSSCLKHPVHRSLHVAYSFYTVPGQFTLTELMKDALILARNKGYDVFNALDIT